MQWPPHWPTKYQQTTPPFEIRPLLEDERKWAASVVTEHFATPEIVSRGVLTDTRVLPGFIAVNRQQRVGLLHYRVQHETIEVVVVVALWPREGIGRRLIEAAMELAISRRSRCIWAVTTNDNEPARNFYRALGWKHVQTRLNAMQQARLLKPEIPAFGWCGQPIRDELEFELLLRG